MANFALHSHSKKYSKSGDIEPIIKAVADNFLFFYGKRMADVIK
jgi:hypothetical protein